MAKVTFNDAVAAVRALNETRQAAGVLSCQ